MILPTSFALFGALLSVTPILSAVHVANATDQARVDLNLETYSHSIGGPLEFQDGPAPEPLLVKRQSGRGRPREEEETIEGQPPLQRPRITARGTHWRRWYWIDRSDHTMDALFPPPFLRPDFPTRARLSEILFYEFGRDGRLAAEHFRNSRNAIIQVGQFALIWEWIVNEPPTPSRQWPTYSGWPTCPLPFDTYVGQPRRGLNLEAYIQTCFVMQALVFSRTDARFEYADGNFEFSYTLVNLGRFDILHNLNDMPALAFRFPYFNERRFVPLQGQGGGTHSSGDSTNTNNLAFQQRPPPPVQIQQPRRAQVPARFPPPRQQPPAEPPSTPPPSPLSPPPQGPTAER